jgi:uncharacterized protein YndB with AHSA1/START domain
MEDHELPLVEREIELDSTPEEVWRWMTESDLTDEWLGARLVARPGGKVVATDRDVIGTVEEVDEGRSITWTWRHPNGEPSQVTIIIDPSDRGCRLTVTERLLPYQITGVDPFVIECHRGTPLMAA